MCEFAGADVNAVAPVTKLTALHCAVIHNVGTDFMKILLDYDANINAKASRGSTPLLLAARRKHSNPYPVKLFLEKGADPKAMDLFHTTVLHASAYNGDLQMTKQFIDLGCDPHVCDRSGCNALWYASHEGHTEIARLLLEHNVSLTVSGKGFKFERIQPETCGAQIPMLEGEARMPFDVAFLGSHRELMRMILAVGPIPKKDKIGDLLGILAADEPEIDSDDSMAVNDSFFVFTYANLTTEHPQSLQRSCRLAIRRYMAGPSFTSAVASLEIPPNVKDFLLCKFDIGPHGGDPLG